MQRIADLYDNQSESDDQNSEYQEQEGSQIDKQSFNDLQPKQTLINVKGIDFHTEDIQDIQGDKLIVQNQQGTRKITLNKPLINQIYQVKQQKLKLGIFKPLYQKVNHKFAWFLLLMQIIQGGFIPSWIQHKPAEKYLRIVWRFFLQGLLLIPFMLYERRTGNETAKQQYKISHMFKLNNLKQAYLSSIPTSAWFTLTLFTFEWNYVAHAAVLGNISSYYACIHRNLTGGVTVNSDLASLSIITIGILMILYDSYTLTFDIVKQSSLDYKMNKLFNREGWQRIVFGNFVSLFASFITFKTQPRTQLALKVYQPYQANFFICIFNCLNISMSSYFFSGSDILSGSSMWGLLGLFSSEQFSGFLFMSIAIGMGGFITSQVTSKLFEQPLLQTFQLFEPIISTLALQLLEVQIIPNGISCIAFLFIISGLFGIILGQHISKLKKHN